MCKDVIRASASPESYPYLVDLFDVISTEAVPELEPTAPGAGVGSLEGPELEPPQLTWTTVEFGTESEGEPTVVGETCKCKECLMRKLQAAVYSIESDGEVAPMKIPNADRCGQAKETQQAQ